MKRTIFAMPFVMAAALTLAAVNSAAIGATIPVALTGFNADLVVENTAVTPYSSYAVGFDVPNDYALYEAGLSTSTGGLPVDGILVSDFTGTTFDIADYAGNNALLLTATLPVGKLDLVTPTAFTTLHVLAGSTNGDSGGEMTGTMVVVYTDSSVTATDYGAPDWFFQSGGTTGGGNSYDYAIQGMDRVHLPSNNIEDNGTNPDLFETVVPIDPTKTVASVYFVRSGPANTGTATAIFGISGDTVEQHTVPEPSSLVLLSLAGVALAYRGLRR